MNFTTTALFFFSLVIILSVDGHRRAAGLVVKCHESRSLETNRRLARRLLADRLDRLLNGQQAVAVQQEAIEQRRRQRSQDQRRRRRDRKQQWREQRQADTGQSCTRREDRSEDPGRPD